MKFTHLHVHSHYSLLDGLPKIKDLVNCAKELGMDSLALTDHGVLYGAVEFFKACLEKEIKPIIGCEVYQAYEKLDQRRVNIDDKRYHLVLLVKNERGYKNLVKLITKAHLEGFYYKPRVDEELLAQYSDGLIALSACLQGKIPQLILANRIEDAKKQALKYQEIFGKGNFYLELQHHSQIPEQEKINKALISFSKELNIPLVATNDSHYLKPDDAEVQDILMLINTGADPNDPERLTMKADDFSLRPPHEMEKLFLQAPEAIENTQKIAEACNFQFELGKTKLPTFQVPDNKKPEAYLEELCYQGLKTRFGENPDNKVIERLKYELSVIQKTGFAGYFLIVQDFVNWAKSNRIVVGPGRGSVGGSLVSYLLNITNVDPLKNNLLFERFLNPERISMPDIDLDFTDRRRDEVINYVAEKYGKDHVAQIITFGTMAARAVIRDVGRALMIPYNYCDRIAKMIPLGMSLEETLEGVQEFKELYESDAQAKRLVDLAKRLEGVARHASTHACGIVISATTLTDYVPLQHPTQNDESIITQYEMHAIEDLGLLKMDLLGLKNLTIIEDCLARIYKVHKESLKIDNIPLDDEKTFKLFREANTTGVFQLECLSGDTIVSNTTIKNLYKNRDRKTLEAVYLDEGKVHRNKILDILKGGGKNFYSLIAENGWYIKASEDHYFLTEEGWKKLKDIRLNEKVLMKNKAKHLIYNICETCGKQIDGQREGKSDFCYKCSATFYKNPSKKESREKIKAARIKFYQQGGKPWNFGVTIENNEVWRKTAEKISKALIGRTFEQIHGIEKAKEIKRKISERSSGKNNPMFGKPSPHRKGGYRMDLGHYVRSTWEADFARILKLHNIDYKYEPQTFILTKENGEIMHYTPDFYVPSQNTFYEIKGWFHDLDKEKVKLFQEQYPQHNFVLISATKFAEFSLQYKTLINWECPRIPVKQSFEFIKIKEIKYAGKEITYDIKMQTPGNNFVANGFVVHNSDGMKRYLKDLKPTTFEDIVAMVALYRPGPMQFIPDFIKGKHGKKKIEYLHPKLEPILKNTYGVCVYQEQLMQIAQYLAGFSLAEADVLRKAVGKKIKELLHAQKEKFITGCIKNKVPKKSAEEVWQWFLPFAQYAFNKSHATAYATIACQTAFLKACYPIEFMAALLTSEKADIERIAVLIQECKKMNIPVLAPDVNESFRNFSVVPDENKIRFGLLAIKNVGENTVESIITERKSGGPFKSMHDFVSRIQTRALNKKSLESLIKSGVFDKLEERNKLLHNLEDILEANREIKQNLNNGQKNLFADCASFNNNNGLRLKPAQAISLTDQLNWEKELLGLYVSSHPLESYKKVFDGKAFPLNNLNNEMVGKLVKIGGIISTIKRIVTRTGKPMLFLSLEDLTDKIEVVVFPTVIEKNPTVFQENKIVFVKGKVDNRDGEVKILADEVEEIVEVNVS